MRAESRREPGSSAGYQGGLRRAPLSGLPMGLLLLLGVCRIVSAEATASAAVDLASYIAQEDARLGRGTGTIVLEHGGRIGQAVTLGRGHDLEVRSPVVWAAPVNLAGNNRVRCVGGGSIAAQTPEYVLGAESGMLLRAAGTQGVSVSGCKVSSQAQSVLLAAMPASDVAMDGNTLTGLTLLATNSKGTEPLSERVTVTNNSVTMGPGYSHNAGVLLFYARQVKGTGNTLVGLGHGVQWWGGNSGEPGANLSQVTRAGQMEFTGNHCTNIGGACIWGSMGSDVVIRGNTADGCGDVCFDTEGGLRTEISGNTATGCNHGCAAVFFFTDQTTISGNHFRADVPGGGLVLIKNVSQNPVTHQHLTISGNELRCLTRVCPAVYQEAAGGIAFTNNQITDGVWVPAGYGSGLVISGNRLEFTRKLADGAAISAPSMLGAQPLEITGNTVTSQVPQDKVCLAASWSDFNAAGFGLIAGNTCGGRGPFPVGVVVLSAGRNPGLAGVWYVGGNRLNGGTVLHTAEGSHEVFYDLGECGADGACRLDAAGMKAARSAPWCGGATGGAGTVCMGPHAGYVAVPVAH